MSDRGEKVTPTNPQLIAQLLWKELHPHVFYHQYICLPELEYIFHPSLSLVSSAFPEKGTFSNSIGFGISNKSGYLVLVWTRTFLEVKYLYLPQL